MKKREREERGGEGEGNEIAAMKKKEKSEREKRTGRRLTKEGVLAAETLPHFEVSSFNLLLLHGIFLLIVFIFH